jgi:hypothetical protein
VIAAPHVRAVPHKVVVHRLRTQLHHTIATHAQHVASAPLAAVPTHVRLVAPTPTLSLAAAAADYVRIVAPGDSTTNRDAASSPKRLFVPPRAPLSPPNGPDSPSSVFGSLFGGSGGGAVLVFAALTGLLVLVRPRISTRCKELVETPLAYRRALSLECPG